jgi:hypothetical protein
VKYYTTSQISENIHETPEGFLVCVGVPIARTGEMVYGEGETPLETDDEGKILISREADEVFRPETIASFEGKAVTITHPTEFVSPDNWKVLAKGIMQNVRRGEGENENDLIADLLITDSIAINLVKNGLREVSCGYEAEYTQTDEGKGIQTNIVGNHLALVQEGRAGSSYAINDHKGVTKMSIKAKIKAIFAKAQDEAMKMVDEEPPEKKEDKSKDEKPEEKKEESKDKGGAGYDELVKIVKDLGEKVDSMKPKDEKPEEKKEEGEKKESKDDDDANYGERLSQLEAAVAQLLEKKSEDSEESEDEDDEAEDDDFEKSTMKDSAMTGDTASRVEILAPGLKAKAKDVKAKALKAAYETKDGKAVIDQLTGGKAPAYDSEEKVNTLFIAASELLKVARAGDLSKTKTTDYKPVLDNQGPMSAERMNEINAKRYNK